MKDQLPLAMNQNDLNTRSHRELKDLVKQHEVTYEVYPIFRIGEYKKKIHIGFEIELDGTHDHPAKEPTHGCSACTKALKDLYKIARWIVPKDYRESTYEICVIKNRIVYSAKRQFRSDVCVLIEIIHREGYDRPVEACQELCVNELQESLKAIGVQKGNWNK